MATINNKTAEETTTKTKQETKTTDTVKASVQKTSTGKLQKQERVMYVGPTVPGIGINNAVYTEMPADAKGVIKEYPEIGNLFIPIMHYPEANVMLREGRGYIYNAYQKARSIKIENAKASINADSDTEAEENEVVNNG